MRRRRAAGDPPLRYGSARDPRPLLIVEFPPQHVAERAFLRRFAAEPDLPEPPPTDKLKEKAETLRSGTLDEREAARAEVSAAQDAAGSSREFRAFRDSFIKEFAVNDETKTIPADQQIYIGPTGSTSRRRASPARWRGTRMR